MTRGIQPWSATSMTSLPKVMSPATRPYPAAPLPVLLGSHRHQPLPLLRLPTILRQRPLSRFQPRRGPGDSDTVGFLPKGVPTLRLRAFVGYPTRLDPQVVVALSSASQQQPARSGLVMRMQLGGPTWSAIGQFRKAVAEAPVYAEEWPREAAPRPGLLHLTAKKARGRP
jgi:hypothetical protein